MNKYKFFFSKKDFQLFLYNAGSILKGFDEQSLDVGQME